ncbi:CmpA/NrtA family ABC transporter substrate-binding protein [Microbulbifer hainanensis]|uniref:CmpA/NrtA family ABC transporter substrate-binding protein n=1 Tax=Microbulbifer hainanensis TaxID=2735675 RepID=UPI0018673990|nr:CmpA/NrtA family ABC transporter substrate-binding protein [Microbulbifer hainanensis]
MPAVNFLNPEKRHLKLLYLRLTDSAPLIVAREMGFFAQLGLDVELQRETSWATLRDKLIGGAADAAAMLAPMPLALEQALPQCEEALLTGLILSCNGNGITLSRRLSEALEYSAGTVNHKEIGAALANYLHRCSPGTTPLKLATVYPFSSHTLQLRHWLQSSGIDPDRDLQILVLPPEQMVDRLRRGDIDGYCVGEPWNTIAAQRRLGTIAVACNTLLPAMPEKVLAVTNSWHQANPCAHLALRVALLRACSWLADDAQRRDAAAILARDEYLDLQVESLVPSLSDQLYFSADSNVQSNPDWHLFASIDSDCGRPTEGKAQQLIDRCNNFAPITAGAQRAFREDLYQQALDFLQWDKK